MTNTQPTDRELLIRFQQGDDAAFTDFYRRYAKGLCFYLRALLADAAAVEDVMQEVVIQIARELDRFIHSRELRTYLYRTAHNRAVNHLRSRQRYNNAIDRSKDRRDLFAREQADPAHNEIAQRAGEALLKLPVELREVVVLRLYQELSFKEIEQLSGVAHTTLFNRYQRALELLRKEINAL